MKEIENVRNELDLDKIPKLVFAFYHCWYGTPFGPTKKWVHWNHPVFDSATPRQKQISEVVAELRLRFNRGELTEEEFKEKVEKIEEKRRDITPVHDPEKFIGPNRRDIGAAHYPSIGPYDSTDPELLRNHIKLAESAGIDVLAFNWWNGHEGGITDLSLKSFCDVAEDMQTNVRATALIDGYCWYGGYPLKKSIEMFRYFLETYGNRKAFLHIEGLPVVMFYQAGVYSPRQWRDIRLALRKSGLDGVLLGGDCFEDRLASVFEGFEYYSPLSFRPFFEGKLREGYARSAEVCRNNGLIMGLAVMPGYDDRQVRFPGTVVARSGSKCYDMTWRVATEQNPNWIMICSWNEWHEGSEIEPSVEYGDYYIKLTRQYADKFKGSL